MHPQTFGSHPNFQTAFQPAGSTKNPAPKGLAGHVIDQLLERTPASKVFFKHN
jgi:hypothetical protein